MTTSIRAVQRALQLLRAMNAQETWALTELVARTGLAKATVHRLLATLQGDGYVHSPAGKPGVYRLTMRTRDLSAGLTEVTHYTDVADAIVRTATRSLDWPVGFTVPEPPFMRVIACGMPHSPEHSAKPTTFGRRRWMFDTAVGRAYLASRSDREVAALREEGEAYRRTRDPALALPDLPTLIGDLDGIRARGYAVRVGGPNEVNSAVAVAAGWRGQVVGALVCSTFPRSLSPEFIARVLVGLRATADEIAQACLA